MTDFLAVLEGGEQVYQRGQLAAVERLGGDARDYDKVLSGVAEVLEFATNTLVEKGLIHRLWHDPLCMMRDTTPLSGVALAMEGVLQGHLKALESSYRVVGHSLPSLDRLRWVASELESPEALDKATDLRLQAAYRAQTGKRVGTKDYKAARERNWDNVRRLVAQDKARQLQEHVGQVYRQEAQRRGGEQCYMRTQAAHLRLQADHLRALLVPGASTVPQSAVDYTESLLRGTTEAAAKWRGQVEEYARLAAEVLQEAAT